MKDHRKALFIAAALIGFGVCSAQAAHKDVKHCADDYRKFCHAWGLETKGLENCMRKHGDKLTNACIAALVNQEMSRKPKSIVGKKSTAAKEPEAAINFGSFAMLLARSSLLETVIRSPQHKCPGLLPRNRIQFPLDKRRSHVLSAIRASITCARVWR